MENPLEPLLLPALAADELAANDEVPAVAADEALDAPDGDAPDEGATALRDEADHDDDGAKPDPEPDENDAEEAAPWVDALAREEIADAEDALPDVADAETEAAEPDDDDDAEGEWVSVASLLVQPRRPTIHTAGTRRNFGMGAMLRTQPNYSPR